MSKAKKDIYRDLISYKDAMVLYSVSRSTLRMLAVRAGAIVKISEHTHPMINCRILEEYFEQSRKNG